MKNYVLLQSLIDKRYWLGFPNLYSSLYSCKNPKFIRILFNYNKCCLLIKHFDIFLKILHYKILFYTEKVTRQSQHAITTS